jgi:2-polyprenyl-3-methyl-5-hydroxy-6-metoxy-1,4-benzoquinol methylase
MHRPPPVTVRRLLTACDQGRDRNEFQTQSLWSLNERPIEYGYVFRCINRLQPRTVLDTGTGESALASLVRTCGCPVTAIDNITDSWPAGVTNRDWHLLDHDSRQPPLTATFDLALCVSVIEHIDDPVGAMRGLARLVRPGGHVLVTTPYHERFGHPNVYTEPDSHGRSEAYPCRQSTRADLNTWLECGFVLRNQEWWRLFEHRYWSCGPVVRPPKHVTIVEHHQLTCLLLERVEATRTFDLEQQ